jgi:hypothetical protein
MSLSIRVGTVLLGLGVLFLGYYVQKKNIQGFQSRPDPAALALPTPADAAIIQPANDQPPLYSVDDLSALVAKDAETRSRMNLITNAKQTSDLLLINYLSSEMMANLSILYKEVEDYSKSISDVKDIFSRTDNKHQNTIRQLIYTASDQADMLYTIYFTIPSNIISTDTIIPSGTATISSLGNPEIIAESAKQVSNVLSTLPSPSSKLNMYLKDLMKSIGGLSTDSSSDDIAQFTSKMKRYLNTVDIQQEHMTTNMADLKSASKRYTVDPAKLEAAATNKSTFLTTTITSLQSIITGLQATTMTNPEIVDTMTNLQGRVTSMQANVTSMKTLKGSGSVEAFASRMNPYDQPSVNGMQSREFSLGRQAYSDEVFSGIKLW